MDNKETASELESACRSGELGSIAEKYIIFCKNNHSEEREGESESEKKRSKAKDSRFPNVAGCCRYLGIGQGTFERLAKKYPDEFEKVAAALEDEALNAEISPSLLGVYLKRRLGYAETSETARRDVDMGQMRLIFEHDILADGE